MENYKIIAQWSQIRFDELFYLIRKAINDIHEQKLNDDGIRINMPDYLIRMINHRSLMNSPLEYEEGKAEMFGCKVYPSFENIVIVYHIDMPIHGNTAYQVIDLKKI